MERRVAIIVLGIRTHSSAEEEGYHLNVIADDCQRQQRVAEFVFGVLGRDVVPLVDVLHVRNVLVCDNLVQLVLEVLLVSDLLLDQDLQLELGHHLSQPPLAHRQFQIELNPISIDDALQLLLNPDIGEQLVLVLCPLVLDLATLGPTTLAHPLQYFESLFDVFLVLFLQSPFLFFKYVKQIKFIFQKQLVLRFNDFGDVFVDVCEAGVGEPLSDSFDFLVDQEQVILLEVRVDDGSRRAPAR